jgi:hypothetical protein
MNKKTINFIFYTDNNNAKQHDLIIRKIFSIARLNFSPTAGQIDDAFDPKTRRLAGDPLLNCCLHFFFGFEFFPVEPILERSKRFIIRGRQIRRVWWVRHDVPSKIRELGFGQSSRVRSGVIMQKLDLKHKKYTFLLIKHKNIVLRVLVDAVFFLALLGSIGPIVHSNIQR